MQDLSLQITKLQNTLEQQEINQKKVLTLKEAARYTGFSQSALYQLTHSKKIPYYKPTGKVIFFEREELEKWLLSNRVSTTADIEQKAVDYCNQKGGAI